MLNSPPARGAMAPYFKLQDEDQQWMTLDTFLKNGPVMLSFYPGDFKIVCTKQLCAYQEALEKFQKLGTQIVGISSNPPMEHKKFKEEYGFSFHLLSDPGKETAKTYGVTSLLLLGGISRSVFLVNRNGMVLYRYIEPTPLSHRRPGELVKIMEELRERGEL